MERVVALLCNPSAGRERALDLGMVEKQAFVGIASLGFDSDANRIANDAPARLDDGLLDIVTIAALSRLHADGDPVGRTPTTIRVLPRAVRELAPR